MNKRESLNSVFYPLGTVVFIVLILFIVTTLISIIEIRKNIKTIDVLSKENMVLKLGKEPCHDKNKRRN